MDKGQYQYPYQSGGLQEPELNRDIEVTLNPEMAEKEGQFAYIKNIEQMIENLRQMADATTIPRYRLTRLFQPIMDLLVSSPSHENIQKKLINIESETGGRQLAKPEGCVSQRFWFHGGDWFYEAQYDFGFIYARYQFSENEAFKLVDGRVSMFAPGELNSLKANIPLYYESIERELYAPGAPKEIAPNVQPAEADRKDDFRLAA